MAKKDSYASRREHLVKMVGTKVGRWSIKALIHESKRSVFVCRCDCGIEKKVQPFHIISGSSRSCGCLHYEEFGQISRTHGQSKTPEYRVWANMIARCENKDHISYPNYGGRGISVCRKWRESFEAFIADMGPRPSDWHSIERKNTNGNYDPSNCCWATKKEQARNRRSNVLLDADGKTQCVAAWLEEKKLNARTVWLRRKSGQTADRALRPGRKK